MKELSLEDFYGQSLGLTAPWKVMEVGIDAESRQVRIRVECASGVVWGDPEISERPEIKDWEERTRRHLTPAGLRPSSRRGCRVCRSKAGAQ